MTKYKEEIRGLFHAIRDEMLADFDTVDAGGVQMYRDKDYQKASQNAANELLLAMQEIIKEENIN